MIVRPSCSQLLEAVRRELRASVRPSLSDPGAIAKIGMIDAILGSVAVRCDHEAAWIREEIAAIEQGAEAVIAAHDPGGRVATALAALRHGRRDSGHLPDLYDDYNLAAEVLSCALEAALAKGGELRTLIEKILQARMAREIEIRGKFAISDGAEG